MGDENHPSTTITWRITAFTTLTESVCYSDMFLVGGVKWRIVLYPKGNHTDHLSIFLEVAESDTLPIGWRREAQYSFTVVNQHNNNLSRTRGKSAEYTTFTSQGTSWGYTRVISLGKLHDISKGFLVNDTLVVKAEVKVKSIHSPIISAGTLEVETTTAPTSTDRFDTLEGLIIGTSSFRREELVAEENITNSETPSLEELQAMGDENHISTKFRWRITSFTRLTERRYYSDMFDVVGTKWRIILYPKGNNTDHLSIYLEVAESDTLPTGWKREVQYSLTVVNQHNKNLSRTEELEKTFTSQVTGCGIPDFISLSELQGISGGFVVNDSLVVEAEVEVKSIHPPITNTGRLLVGSTAIATSTNRFDTYFASLEGLIVGTSSGGREESVVEENVNSEAPSLEEVKQAKPSLKECLTDLSKLNMKEKLAQALSTLSLSKNGLSSEQRKTVVSFWENFDEFTSDFLTFEKENSDYELQKILKDEIFRAMEKNHKTHLSFKQSHSEFIKEGEELKKTLEDIGSKITNLLADWDSLLVESEKLESNYKAQEKKVADAEEKKRIAEERMSRSTAAWANLKKQFGCEEL